MLITDKYPWMTPTSLGDTYKITDPKSEYTFYVHMDNYDKFVSKNSNNGRVEMSDVVVRKSSIIKCRLSIEELLDSYYETM